MDFKTWLSTLPGSPTPSIAAKTAGLAGPTLLRHAERGHSTADNVIVISRSYGVPPVEALVHTGFLDEDEVMSETLSIRRALATAGIDEALQLLVDKVNGSGIFETAFTVDDLDVGAAVSDLHPVTTPDVEGLPYVADSSPDEPGEGDDDYHDGP